MNKLIRVNSIAIKLSEAELVIFHMLIDHMSTSLSMKDLNKDNCLFELKDDNVVEFTRDEEKLEQVLYFFHNILYDYFNGLMSRAASTYSLDEFANLRKCKTLAISIGNKIIKSI